MKKAVFIILTLTVVLGVFLSSCSDEIIDAHTPLDPMDTELSGGYSDGYGNLTDEHRGVYIATAYNIDFPSKSGLDADALAEELDAIVDTVDKIGANAIYFQVRPNSDALYDSELFPVSSYLTGKPDGELPDGFDPLLYLVKAAHAREIEVHAWINPLRVTRGSLTNPKTDVTALAEMHPARLSPYMTVEYAGELYYNPALPEVRALVSAGITEIVQNYDVDGILFDDYFYPYPETDENGAEIEFDDADEYALLGGSKSLDDWRRANINALVKSSYEAVKEANADCRFGVAPFGIWQNKSGDNGGSATLGMEAYKSIYCDALAWAEGGYVDYIAPQIYWSFSQENAAYDVIADWWNSRLDGTGVELYISHAAYRYGTDSWTEAGVVDEMTAQLRYARGLMTYKGSLMYGYAEVRDNIDGIGDELAAIYSDAVVYADSISTGGSVAVTSPEYASKTDKAEISLYCKSDPTVTVTYGGEPVSRRKDGSFILDVTLRDGENYFEFYTKYGKYVFMVEKTADVAE